jgi:hypothetical protein
MLPNGEKTYDAFPGGTEMDKTQFIQEFIEGFEEEGLNGDNVEHFNSVKAVVDVAIQKNLDEEQQKKDLLSDYDDETLESMHCIKIYPDNASLKHSTSVGQYYSHALATYPLCDNDNNNNKSDRAADIWGNSK